MIKNLKKILVFGVFALILPLGVKADYGLSVQCIKSDNTNCTESNGAYQVTTGETVRFNFTVTGDNVGGFLSDIVLSSNLTGPSNFGYNTSFWDGTRNGGFSNNKIVLAKNNGTGDPIFNFSVVTGTTAGEATITFSNVDVSDSQGDDTSLPNKVVTLNVVTATDINTGNNENTNTENNTSVGGTDTNANTNDNTNANTDAKTDVSETKKEAPSNPDTGVTLSALGIALLVVGGISYISLRKKNYFNRI